MRAFKKFKTVVITIILVLLLIPGVLESLISPSFYQSIGSLFSSNDYARITELDYKAIVADEQGSSGKIIITERITFEIHAASSDNLFWELWRDLPEEYIDGVKVEYNVLSVRQILEDGTALIYEESPKLYWYDSDFTDYYGPYGPGKWYHSKGPYDNYYNFECLLFYVDGLYRETVVFEIEYEMMNASLRYNDSSELYVSLYYGDSIKFLTSLKGEILFPDAKMPKEGNYDAYTYGTNSHDFPFTESTTINPGYHTFSFELHESQLNFKPYNQYIEFALIAHGDDKHIFTQYTDINHYYFKDMLPDIIKAQNEYERLPLQAERNKTIILVLSIVGSVFIGGIAYFINSSIKKKNKFYKPSMEMEYFRDIPSDLDASFASRLVFCKHKKKDTIGDGYSAAMLSLVYKGYIELAQIDSTRNWANKNVKIVVKQKESVSTDTKISPLTPVEERYLALIIRHSNGAEIPHTTFQRKISTDYEYTNFFVRGVETALKTMGISGKYFQKNQYKAPRSTMRIWSILFVIIAIVIVCVGNPLIYYNTRLDLAHGSLFILGFAFIVAAIYLYFVSRKYFLLTQFGENEYAKWRGLYHFLNSETLMKEREVLELVIWEKYLIYATAFGISEKVIKALKIRCPQTIMDTSPILYNPYFRSSYFRSNVSSSFRNSTRSASFSARSGGHGGYGGGGRGGGGGGGGH